MEKKGVINFDELGDQNLEPKFIEEIRRDEKGEIIAYVMKRNPKYKA